MVAPEDFKELVLAMIDFRLTGKEPPEFENNLTQLAARFIFPQIERSRAFSEIGAKGGKATAKVKKNGADDNASSEGTSDASSEGVSNASSEGASNASSQDKTETRQDETRQDETRRESNAPSRGKPQAEAETDGGTDAECEERFERFWKIYPRHVGKNAAREEFLKLSPSEELTEKIISAVSAQCGSEQWRRENGRFIPNPTTYLSQARWEDELSTDIANVANLSGSRAGHSALGRTAFSSALLENSETSGKEFEEWFEAKLLQNFGP